MKFVKNDGGRSEAGYKGSTDDCVVRAIAIASGLSYSEVYKSINDLSKSSERGKKKSNARLGVFTKKKWFKDYMASLGFEWTACAKIGEGCKAHMTESELPTGRLVVSVRKHMTAVIDGVVNDMYDPRTSVWTDENDIRHEAPRAVYGYYKKKSK